MDQTVGHSAPAGFVSRGIAFMVDLVVMGVAVLLAIAFMQAVVGFFTVYGLVGQRAMQSGAFRALVVAVTALIGAGIGIGYPVGFWVLLGRTPGKLLMGLRVARSDGHRLTLGPALLRYVGYWLSAIPLGLGFLWVLVDDRRQAWHDKLAGTVVTYEPKPTTSSQRQLA